MKTLSFLFFIISIINISFANTNMIQTDDINIIKNKFQNADKDTLIIFDIDDVIILPEDQIFHPKYKNILFEYDKEFSKRYSEEEVANLWSIVWLKRKAKLINPRIIKLLESLEKLEIPYIALTNCGTGKVKYIAKLEDWRLTS